MFVLSLIDYFHEYPIHMMIVHSHYFFIYS